MGNSVSVSRDGFRPLYKGQRLSARYLNALLDLAPSRLPGPNETRDQFGTTTRRPAKIQPGWIRVKSDADADAFSIAAIYDGEFIDGDFVYHVRQYTGVEQMFVGNEDFPFVANADGWALPITPSNPVRVRAAAALSFLQSVSPQDSSDILEANVGGALLVIASSETVTGDLLTGVIAKICAPVLVGKVKDDTASGAFGNVEVWTPPSNGIVNSIGDLIDSNDYTPALFAFGGASQGLWVGLADAGFAWIAFALQCDLS